MNAGTIPKCFQRLVDFFPINMIKDIKNEIGFSPVEFIWSLVFRISIPVVEENTGGRDLVIMGYYIWPYIRISRGVHSDV
jgi:hypothetical protein